VVQARAAIGGPVFVHVLAKRELARPSIEARSSSRVLLARSSVTTIQGERVQLAIVQVHYAAGLVFDFCARMRLRVFESRAEA
jgi:hypothetical protein